MPIKIDIIVETICPWCYIGYAKLKDSLNHFKDLKTDVIWRPFQLNPDMPL